MSGEKQDVQRCDHARTVAPTIPIPDWTGTCPSCGERVKHNGRGGFTEGVGMFAHYPTDAAPRCGVEHCPCQDGDPCHYEDDGDTKAMRHPALAELHAKNGCWPRRQT